MSFQGAHAFAEKVPEAVWCASEMGPEISGDLILKLLLFSWLLGFVELYMMSLDHVTFPPLPSRLS